MLLAEQVKGRVMLFPLTPETISSDFAMPLAELAKARIMDNLMSHPSKKTASTTTHVIVLTQKTEFMRFFAVPPGEKHTQHPFLRCPAHRYRLAFHRHP
jgi:hypothetical protein